MKRFLATVLIIGLLLFPVVSFTADPVTETKTLKFLWEQPVDWEYLSGWVLYWSDAKDSGYVKIADIPRPGTQSAEYTTSQVLTITGPPRGAVTKYFVITAKDTRGMESLYSEAASQTFEIPWPLPARPMSFTVEVVVIPK